MTSPTRSRDKPVAIIAPLSDDNMTDSPARDYKMDSLRESLPTSQPATDGSSPTKKTPNLPPKDRDPPAKSLDPPEKRRRDPFPPSRRADRLRPKLLTEAPHRPAKDSAIPAAPPRQARGTAKVKVETATERPCRHAPRVLHSLLHSRLLDVNCAQDDVIEAQRRLAQAQDRLNELQRPIMEDWPSSYGDNTHGKRAH